jgi:phosphate transporter
VSFPAIRPTEPATEGDYDYEHELADYTEIQHRKDADARQHLEDERRRRKREWLEAQDDMKFSHSIQFNAVPDWSTHYIAYSNLKKL